MTKPVIICDFDGTVTTSDNIIAIMKKFAPPQWEQLKDDILAQKISIREGVGSMFSLLPSTQKEEITDYIFNHAEIRDGFTDFVNYTKEQKLPLYIVSGGIDFFVYPLLKGLVEESHIYCNVADFSGKTIAIGWPNPCDANCTNDCGCCKPSLIRKLVEIDQEKIVIGDSVTDLQAAKLADFVIARDYLLEKCQTLNLPHKCFTTFHDVIEILENRKGIGV